MSLEYKKEKRGRKLEEETSSKNSKKINEKADWTQKKQSRTRFKTYSSCTPKFSSNWTHLHLFSSLSAIELYKLAHSSRPIFIEYKYGGRFLIANGNRPRNTTELK